MDGRRTPGKTGRQLSHHGAQLLARCLVSKGVAVSCIGWQMGKTILVDTPIVTNQQINSIETNGSVDDLYLYYALLHRRRELFALGAGGSRTPILKKSAFEKVEVLLPPRSEQARIAAILGSLDDKIELNRKMNETLEQMAQAIFKSWFIDFDGHTEFQDSPLGPIPKGWTASTLGDELNVLETGSRPKGGVSTYTSGIPSVGAESIVGLARFDFSKTKYVPFDFFEGMRKGHLQSRDVLIYKDGGKPGLLIPHVSMFGDGFPFERCCINEHVYRVRCDGTVGQNFLYYWLSSERLLDEMARKGTGVAVPGLNTTAASSLSMLKAPPDVLNRFNSSVEPMVASQLHNARESQTLAELRDTLLPKLISGELRIKAAEKAVGEAI